MEEARPSKGRPGGPEFEKRNPEVEEEQNHRDTKKSQENIMNSYMPKN